MAVFEDDVERPTTSLRGRLADVYYPALLAESHGALAIRLGQRARTYNPILGGAAGLGSIQAHLNELADWLADKGASYAPARGVNGVDRDVTEGLLSLRLGGAHIDLPVAVVTQRMKAREVDLRAYHATVPLERWQAARPSRPPSDKDYVLPNDVAAHLGALRLGDADALVSGFESEGSLRDGAGKSHAREGDKLLDFYVGTLQVERGANDWVPIVISCADDGRSCAVEYQTEKVRGGEIRPKEGLMIFERGDSGLFRSVRVYDELGL